jgi:hypothetical protein
MPFMLSEPLDDSSSDTKSFDEEDMYGSDPDVETVSLPSISNQVQSLEHTVRAYIYDSYSRYHTYVLGRKFGSSIK